MGYVDLPDQPPATGGKLQGTIVLDEQELRVTVGLLKDALAELTKGMANGFSHAAAAPLAATPSRATAAQAGPRAATTVQLPRYVLLCGYRELREAAVTLHCQPLISVPGSDTSCSMLWADHPASYLPVVLQLNCIH
jgi:hypothetical protein